MIVKFNKPTFLHLAGKLTLKPGANTVSAKVWADLAKNPTVKVLVDAGVIEYAEEDLEVVDEATEAAYELESLLKLKVKEAVATVKETINVDLLKAWFAAEKKQNVKLAITAQLEALEGKVEIKAASEAGLTVKTTDGVHEELVASPGHGDE